MKISMPMLRASFCLMMILFMSCIPLQAQNYDILTLGTEESVLPLNDNIACVFYQTRDGFAWVGTGRNLVRLDGGRSSAYEFEHSIESAKPAPQRVTALCERHDGELFVGNVQGLWRADHRTHLLRRVAAKEIQDSVVSLSATHDGLLLVETSRRKYVLDGKNEVRQQRKETKPYPNSDARLRAFASKYLSAKINEVSLRGNLLAVGTDGMGLYLLDAQTGGEIAHFMAETDGLLSNQISSVWILTDGSILCGTPFYQGFNLLRYHARGFERLSALLPAGREIYARSYLRTRSYEFVGSRDGFYVNGCHFTKATHSVLRSDIVFCFAPWQGDSVLVGTCGGGLAVFDPRTGRFGNSLLTRQCAPQGDIFQMERDGDQLWLATSEGLYRFSPSDGLRRYDTRNAGLPGNLVYGFNLYPFVLATDGGVAEFNPSRGHCSKSLSKVPTRMVYRTREGGHIFQLRLDNRVVADGRLLHGILAYDVTEALDGTLFFATPQGVLQMSRDLKSYRLLSDGWHRFACSAGARLTWGDDGTLIICASDGVYSVSTSRPLSLRRAFAQDLRLDAKEEYIYLYGAPPDTLVCLNADQNTMSFSLSTSDVSLLSGARYEYLLEGRGDTLWQSVEANNQIQFFNLPSGDYKLRVRLLLDSGSETAVSFRIAEDHPVIFVMVPILLLGLGIVVIVWYKMRHTSVKPDLMERTPYSRNTLSVEDAGRVAQCLRQYMEESKAYLNVNLKQAEVAVAVGQPTYVVSAVLSQHLYTNWYDFINMYRVEAFKQAVAQGQHELFSIVALSERCGFKSKASFFRAFKAETGITPNEYISITKQ